MKFIHQFPCFFIKVHRRIVTINARSCAPCSQHPPHLRLDIFFSKFFNHLVKVMLGNMQVAVELGDVNLEQSCHDQLEGKFQIVTSLH